MNKCGDSHGGCSSCPDDRVRVVHARTSAYARTDLWGPPPPYQPPAPEQIADLDEVYAAVAASLDHFGPEVCHACGKCCHFTPTGLMLFGSALEMAYLVSSAGVVPLPPEPATPEAEWACPYQRENLCTARRGRPLGCRTYFCHELARADGELLYAEALREVQRIARRQGNPWWYGPARTCLEAWAGTEVGER